MAIYSKIEKKKKKDNNNRFLIEYLLDYYITLSNFKYITIFLRN